MGISIPLSCGGSQLGAFRTCRSLNDGLLWGGCGSFLGCQKGLETVSQFCVHHRFNAAAFQFCFFILIPEKLKPKLVLDF